jgi:ABC-type uncharacterized transport system permease subunit
LAVRWLCCIIAMLLGLWISFSWRLLVNTVAWTSDAWGIGRGMYALAIVVSGD